MQVEVLVFTHLILTQWHWTGNILRQKIPRKFFVQDLRPSILVIWIYNRSQWRIQDFPEEGAPTPGGGGALTYNFAKFPKNFPKNCMKLKEFGPPGARVPRTPLRSATGSATI